jgi:hypothetical protein
MIALARGEWIVAMLPGLVVLIPSTAVFALGRLGERFIAKRCIRRYLEVRSVTEAA